MSLKKLPSDIKYQMTLNTIFSVVSSEEESEVFVRKETFQRRRVWFPEKLKGRLHTLNNVGNGGFKPCKNIVLDHT